MDISTASNQDAMSTKYVATTENSPFSNPRRNREFATRQEAEAYADSYNMGADYSYMSVFAVQKDI